MNLTSKFLCVGFLILTLGGCVQQNFVSSPGFKFYVSGQKFIDFGCSSIENMIEAYGMSNPNRDVQVVRKFSGITHYNDTIPPDILRQILEENYKALLSARDQKSCQG